MSNTGEMRRQFCQSLQYILSFSGAISPFELHQAALIPLEQRRIKHDKACEPSSCAMRDPNKDVYRGWCTAIVCSSDL